MNSESNVRHLDIGILRKNQGWFMTFGIIMIVLGVIAVAAPFVATFAVVTLIGALFIAAGVMHVIHAFRSRTWGESLFEFLLAILFVLAGIILLAYPLGSIFTLTLFLAAFFVVEGIFKVIQALRLRQVTNWGWMFFSGIASLFLGIIIWAGLPMTAFWAIGLIVGIDLIFGGISTVMVARSMRSAVQERRRFCIGNVCFE